MACFVVIFTQGTTTFWVVASQVIHLFQSVDVGDRSFCSFYPLLDVTCEKRCLGKVGT